MPKHLKNNPKKPRFTVLTRKVQAKNKKMAEPTLIINTYKLIINTYKPTLLI